MNHSQPELMKKIDNLVDFLNTKKVWFKQNYPLQYETYFKTGGVAKVFVCPGSIEAFTETLKYCRSIGLEYQLVGLTSNVFFLNEIDYTVVITTKHLNNLRVNDSVVDVECGYSLEEFVRVMLLQAGAGFEGLEGIPGTMGGGIVMNAGAYGDCISDNLVSVTYLDQDNTVKEIGASDCQFGYRWSIFRQTDLTILSGRFKIIKGDVRDISRKIERCHIARHCYQEFSVPTLGSLFSINRNIYTTILKRHSKVRYLPYLTLYAVLYNRFAKFLRRKRPQQIIFNRMLTSYLKTDFYAPSVKHMNILCNNGLNSTEDMIRYIKILRENIPAEFRIENEIMTKSIFHIKPDFEETFEMIQEIS